MSTPAALYLFDDAGGCIARLQGVHADMAAEVARRNGAAAYVLGDTLHPMDHVRLVGGAMCVATPEPRVQSYSERRYLSYPPISEQLDALWHAMDSGTLPRVPAFYDPIAAVKAANPKE